jgi:glutamate N-acetyltransferase/amino-acid N-acetyltransferase
MKRARHITLPRGFAAAGVACGVKQSGREDLAIIAADRDAAAAIVTTRNQVVGAPVQWCRRILPRGRGRIRAIVINSGVSNVGMGKAGLRNAETMAALTAGLLGTSPQKVLVASTGVIGEPLPMGRIRAGISAAARSLGRTSDRAALRAIMTTDTREKSAVIRRRLGGRTVTVAGMAKGSGMIAPSLATMIAVLTTDAAATPAALHKALISGVGPTFNAVTIDSDTSTSDTVAVLASGAAGNKAVTASSASFRTFAAMLAEVCGELARAIAADGEGATKLISVRVTGARSDAEAEVAAKAVANSPLFKCAVHGADPNWGRIVAALGKSAARVDGEKLSVRIGGVSVFAGGARREFDRRRVRRHLAGSEVTVDCDLALGRGAFAALTCDLSKQYVAINAEYHT